MEISNGAPHALAKDASEDIDDYMSMTFIEPAGVAEKETYTQRRIRKQREAEDRSRPKSKAELAAAADVARHEALSTALPATSKGFQMMAKLGFQPGSSLGASTNANARVQPIEITVKEDKGGVGMVNERKRKFREQAAAAELSGKRQKAEEGDYRERVGREKEEKRVEGLCLGAMKVLEGLEHPENTHQLPLKKINVLWRALPRGRQASEDERRMRHDMNQSSTGDQTLMSSEEDEPTKVALGAEEQDIEEDDEELETFLALEGKLRLRQLVQYLRAEHHYCFWCKCKYGDDGLEGCPGFEEDDHN